MAALRDIARDFAPEIRDGIGWTIVYRTGYICPHCESRLRAGETLPNIQASQKARPQRTKGATP